MFVKIFPNVLQSLQKNLENSWTQAVDATLILPTISISCGSLKIRKQKDIKHYSDFLLLSIYICVDLLLILLNTCTHRALLVLIKLATCSVQFLTREESKDLSARKVWPIFSNICCYHEMECNNLYFTRELTILMQK